MAFQPGQSGNPTGRRKEKPWRDALTLALKDGDGLKLRNIAEKLVAAAEAGDLQAIKEIADRLDGKPVQALANDEESPLIPGTMTDEQLNERIVELSRKIGIT